VDVRAVALEHVTEREVRGVFLGEVARHVRQGSESPEVFGQVGQLVDAGGSDEELVERAEAVILERAGATLDVRALVERVADRLLTIAFER
jgi:hypothetical protein